MLIRYLAGQYGFPADFDHIATVRQGEEKLLEMARDLLLTGDLLAIYIPEGTDGEFATAGPEQRGHIVGAVRLKPLPAGGSLRDYVYPFGDPNPRWPVGWPVEVVASPPPASCPTLRSLVDLAFDPGNLQAYAGMLRHGPIRLRGRWRRYSTGRSRRFCHPR